MSSDLNYLLTLDVPEKLELIGVLWDSIDESTHPVAMPDALVAELDRRKAGVVLQQLRKRCRADSVVIPPRAANTAVDEDLEHTATATLGSELEAVFHR